MARTKIIELVKNVRSHSPLVHSIMNYVTINDCANVLLAIGASPIMADALEETAEVTAHAGALVLNIGTLKSWTKDAMICAGKMANQMKIPVVLDPVGVGVSNLRKETVKAILEQVKLSVIRGNLSEIAFISGEEAQSKGVDNSEEESFLKKLQIAKKAAYKWNTIIAVTGKNDLITDGERQVKIQNGTCMLSKITGTGCMTTALIGAFLTEKTDPLMAAAAGIAVMGIAGEVAEEYAGNSGTGSFKTALMDVISQIDEKIIRERIKIEKE